ncbi:MAG: TetR/AcrR family transcriptional regulator [candidate division Zixibacteria bacterium]|nr:TetR/AcrR family transcriptional regulator [candidate division Zixibacteria bacterium]
MARSKDIDSVSKSKIYEAAIDEFAESGFAGARVDIIARRATVNKAMIYYHFSSKENLYRLILSDKIENLSELITQKIDDFTDLESFLLSLSEYYNTVFCADRRFINILLRELAGGGKFARDLFSETLSRRQVPKMIQKFIGEGIESGHYRKVDPKQVILSFIGMNLFYLFIAPMANQVWEIEDEETFLRKRPAEVVRLFMRGLEKK